MLNTGLLFGANVTPENSECVSLSRLMFCALADTHWDTLVLLDGLGGLVERSLKGTTADSLVDDEPSTDDMAHPAVAGGRAGVGARVTALEVEGAGGFPWPWRYLLMLNRWASVGFSTYALTLSTFWWPVTLQMFSAHTSFLLSTVTDVTRRQWFVYNLDKPAFFEIVFMSSAILFLPSGAFWYQIPESLNCGLVRWKKASQFRFNADTYLRKDFTGQFSSFCAYILGSLTCSRLFRPWWFFSSSWYRIVTYSRSFSSTFTTKLSLRSSLRPSHPRCAQCRAISKYTLSCRETGSSLPNVPEEYARFTSPAVKASLCWVTSSPRSLKSRRMPVKTWLQVWKPRSLIRLIWRFHGGEVMCLLRPARMFISELLLYSPPFLLRRSP